MKTDCTTCLPFFLPSQSQTISTFPQLERILKEFKANFAPLSFRKRFKRIQQTLCDLIREAPLESFLLNAVLHYLEQINTQQFLHQSLTLLDFEFWLNHFSLLSEKENHEVRAKIVGKSLPRQAYQAFFPIGMNKAYKGSHFVVAHLSPDVDTMIASFWGWIDAFAARVGTGLHMWCLPGGAPESAITSIFAEMFGTSPFPYLARTNPQLTLTAKDLVNQHKLKKELGHSLLSSMEYDVHDEAILLVDEEGHYLGDWQNSDAEQVRHVVVLVKTCLHAIESYLHTSLISLFAKEDLKREDFSASYQLMFNRPLKECEPIKNFSVKQCHVLHDFFSKVLEMEEGIHGTFSDLNAAFHRLDLNGLQLFQDNVQSMSSSDLFDQSGYLKDNYPLLFTQLRKWIEHLDHAMLSVYNYLERLDIGIKIKTHVLQIACVYLTLDSDVEEIRQKMQSGDYLPVVIQEEKGGWVPIGIIRERDMRDAQLGTVTLRDFCNFDEAKISPYLEVISVVDHHKSVLKTSTVPTALIGDAQSCNVLVAEQTFQLNDRYGTRGMDKQQIETQIQEYVTRFHTLDTRETRILQRLLQRRIVASQSNAFYVHPLRELNEYLSFLYAILDDTDLLTKVSQRDVECVAELLNRLKTLSNGKETEILDFDDIPKDENFTKKAAQRILRQEDMYALYRHVYHFREKEVETHLAACIKEEPSNIFLDTKEQNRCTRVGQTKLFTSNFPFFMQHADAVREQWLKRAEATYRQKPAIDLHVHMISTIPSAKEVYAQQIGPYAHRDELWIWIPQTQDSQHHLQHFLNGFQSVIKGFKETLSLEFLGNVSEEIKSRFEKAFLGIPTKERNTTLSQAMVVLCFKASALNSRKTMITPFLPQIV